MAAKRLATRPRPDPESCLLLWSVSYTGDTSRPCPQQCRSATRAEIESSFCPVRSGRSLGCQARNGVALLHHLVDRVASFHQRPGRASLNAFAATGAVSCLTPLIPQIAHDEGMDAARCNLPNIRSFQLRTHPDATRAEDTTILVQDEARMRHVNRQPRVVV